MDATTTKTERGTVSPIHQLSRPEHIPLRTAAKRIRDALRQGDVGYSIAAPDVVYIASTWAEYVEEAGGRSFHQWLRAEVSGSKRFGWWRHLADAVNGLGMPVAARLHTRSVIYLWHTVPGQFRAGVMEAALKLSRLQPVPVSYGQMLRLARLFMPERARVVSACACCDALRAQIVEMGGKPRV